MAIAIATLVCSLAADRALAQSIVVDHTIVHFGSQVDASGAFTALTPAQTITVSFSGASQSWTTATEQPWIHIEHGSAPGVGKFTVSIVNPNNVLGSAPVQIGRILISSPGAANSPLEVQVTLTVDHSGETDPPFGQIDAPAQNAAGLQGAIGVSGWAVDAIGIANIKVYRPCFAFDNPAVCQVIDGSNVVFIADGVFLDGARPDVESAYPGYPFNYRAGWGVQILSNMLPHIPHGQPFGGVGTFELSVFATDLEGQRVRLGRSASDHTPTTITLDNDAIAKPFGTIDTPGQGETVAGTLANFGWAITPDANTSVDGSADIAIPSNGSTIAVFLDGVYVGLATYNQCRGNVGSPVPAGTYCNDDVASIFGNPSPQPPLTTRVANPTKFRNLDAGRGPQAYSVIDTMQLADGMHTLAWSVTDSNGRVEGIGSRFFTVFNGDASQAARATSAMAPDSTSNDATSATTMTTTPARSTGGVRNAPGRPTPSRPAGSVSARRGFDTTSAGAELTIGGKGVRSIAIASGDRLELSFADPVTGGHLVAGDGARALPVGSHLDTTARTFAWVAPAGFFGTYRLAFDTAAGAVVVDVTVR